MAVYAAKRENGRLTALVVNLSDTEHHILLQISGVTRAEVEVWLFDATYNAEDLS